MADNPIVELARRALSKLIADEPQGVRVCEALKQLQPIIEKPVEFEHRDEIVEMINDANDENAPPKERAESVAQVITTIFRLCR